MAKNKEGFDFNLTGTFDIDTMEITHEDKTGIKVYSLLEYLKRLDGKEISISGNTYIDIQPKSVR